MRLLLALTIVGATLAAPPRAAAQSSEPDEEGDQRARRDGPRPRVIDQADLGQSVLLVPFSAETRESSGAGALLEAYVRDRLQEEEHLRVFMLEDLPPVEDVEAELYYRGCPPGNELGCQFVIGEVGRMDRVVGGRVTVREDGRYRVVITILNVSLADVEYTYAVDLGAGEEDVLPSTLRLALDRLRREELSAPDRSAAELQRAAEEAMANAATAEEKRILSRMDADLTDDEVASLNLGKRNTVDRITEDEIEQIKSSEGVLREWDEMGLTERQYVSYRNSGLDWDVWRWRWAGHQLMVLGSVQVGFVGGATGLSYYGQVLRTEDVGSGIADSYAWETVAGGSSFVLGGSIGFGILRNFDLEVGFAWARSPVRVELATGKVVEADDGSGLIPDPANRPSDTTQPSGSLLAGDVIGRFFLLTVPVVRPTVGAGFWWATYPKLFATGEDAGGIPADFPRFNPLRLTDFGVALEPGVQVEVNRWFGIFLRVPVQIGLNPRRRVASTTGPPAIINNYPAFDAQKPPFGMVRVVAGVQARLFGKPVQQQERRYIDEDVEDWDEADEGDEP